MKTITLRIVFLGACVQGMSQREVVHVQCRNKHNVVNEYKNINDGKKTQGKLVQLVQTGDKYKRNINAPTAYTGTEGERSTSTHNLRTIFTNSYPSIVQVLWPCFMAPFFWPFAISSRALHLPAVLARIQAEMPSALAFALLRAALAAVSHSARGRLNAPVGPSSGSGGRGRRDGGVRAEDAAATES